MSAPPPHRRGVGVCVCTVDSGKRLAAMDRNYSHLILLILSISNETAMICIIYLDFAAGEIVLAQFKFFKKGFFFGRERSCFSRFKPFSHCPP